MSRYTAAIAALEEREANLQAELNQTEAEIEKVRTLLRDLRSMESDQASPQLSAPSSEPALIGNDLAGETLRPPPTTRAILIVLKEHSVPMTDSEILEELQSRGWGPDSKTPLSALRMSLSRLLNKHESIERIGTSTYVLKESAPIETDPDVENYWRRKPRSAS